jgi:hypothetical protein
MRPFFGLSFELLFYHPMKTLLMTLQGINIRIIDASKSFISFRYVNSNARSRVKRSQFMQDYESGVFNVINPEALGEAAKEEETT